MSDEPDEVVCFTETAFRDACAKYNAATDWPYLRPGQTTVGFQAINVRIVYRPPPPRDDAREAFLTWLSGPMSGGWLASEDPAYRAFLAGRARVKPEPSVPSQPALDRAWNAAIEAAALECSCCNSNAVAIRKLLREPPTPRS